MPTEGLDGAIVEVLDAVASLLIVVDREGRVTGFNRACELLTGFRRDEVLGRYFWEAVMAPEQAGAGQARLARLLEGKPLPPFESQWVTRVGDRRHLAWSAQAVTDAAGRFRYAVGTATDITQQRQAERALSESERWLRLAAENSPDLMFHQDADLRFTWFSRVPPPLNADDFLGRTDADLAALGLVEPGDAARLAEVKRRVLRTGAPERADTCHRVGGVSRYYETVIQPRLDDDGAVAGLACYARDVTGRRLAEQALLAANEDLERRVAERTSELEARTRQLARSEQHLREQERLLRLIVDHMGDGVVVADRAGRFLLFNPAAERIIGRGPADLPLEDWPGHYRFHLPDGRTPYPPHELPLQRALRGEQADDMEIFVRHPGRPAGSWISTTARPIFDEHGRLAGGVTVVRDLTDRKAAERALRQGEERYERAAEAGRVGVWELDLATGELYLSPNLKRLLGYADHELPNHLDAWCALVHPDDKQPTIDATEAHLRGDTPVFQVEVRRRHGGGGGGGGEYRWFLAQGTALRDGQGRPYRMVGSDTDVTERKRVEERLRDSERHHRELAEHNRWLVRELEHRVGNNLAGLLALVSLMRGRSPDVNGFADAIEARLRAMSDVHRVLATAGGEPVAIRAVAEAALATMRSMASHAAAEDLHGPDVAVAPKQVLPLMLILVELYTNSCKYGVHSAPSAGRLRLAWDVAARGDGPAWIRINWTERGGPPIRGTPRPSLGTQLVHEFARRELEGRCDMQFPPDGADHVLEFPLVAQAQAAVVQTSIRRPSRPPTAVGRGD
jgi:PAS domain S-box-containing protein